MCDVVCWRGLSATERDEIDQVCHEIETQMAGELDDAEHGLLPFLQPGPESLEAYEQLRSTLALLAARQAAAIYRQAQISGAPAILIPALP